MGKEFMKKWGPLSLLFILLLAVMAGCGSEEEGTEPQDENGNEEISSEESSDGEGGAEDGHFPVTLTDDAGNELTIEEEPETIASLQPSNTEITFALGLGDKVVGVTEFCNFPEEVMDIDTIGAQEIDAEQILTILPDVLLVTDYHWNNHGEVLEQFTDAGIHVIVIGDDSSFADVYESIELIAEGTGAVVEAEELIVDMKERHNMIIEKAEEVTEEKTVWVEVAPSPDIFTTGQKTFLHEMLESIQATNAAEDHEGWVNITEEEIVQLNPDVIITTYGYYVEDPLNEVLSRDGWEEVPAVKNEQVFDVDNDTVTRPGPRLIEGVETLAELIYPEVFE